MPRPDSPKVKIGQSIPLPFHSDPQPLREFHVWIHVEQNAARISNQPVRPTGYHNRPGDSRQGVHPKPAKYPSQHEACDHQNRYSGVGRDVDDRRPHVVVTMGIGVAVMALLETHLLWCRPTYAHRCAKLVRLRNRINGLQIAILGSQSKGLSRPVRTECLDLRSIRFSNIASLAPKPEAWRGPCFVNVQQPSAIGRAEQVRLLMAMRMLVPVPVPVPVPVMMMLVPTCAQEPRTRDV